MYLLDSHCDTPSQILRLRDLSIDNDHSHVDFPKLSKGGVDGAFFALYVPASMKEDDAYTYSYRLLEAVRATVELNPDKAAFAVSHAQALANKEAGLFSVCGISVLGAAMHNVGQILAAMVLMRSVYVAAYLSWLLPVAVATGLLTGGLCSGVLKALPKEGKAL